MPRKTEDQLKYETMLMLARRLQELKALEKCEHSFREFIKEAWKVVEPGRPYVPGWHIDAIAEHLEALSRRDIRNLIINISPRSCKSTLIAVMWPAWRWIKNPEETFLTASYSSGLSIRDSRKCRNLIKSEWYQKAWSSRFAITKDQNEKGRFENDKGGMRLATSVDGANLGEGADVMVLDDPNDLNTIESPIIRQNTIDWYDGVMSSRYKNPMTDIRLCVQQRGHMDDMTAHLLSQGDWELLTIPMEYEGPSKPTSIGWMDPRNTIGELMHPDRFSNTEIEKLKKVQGPHRFCTPGHTPILMADWSEKRIDQIAVGDEIIGYAHGAFPKKSWLTRATVLDVSKSIGPVMRVKTKGGREVQCTPDHRWYRKMRQPGKPEYVRLKMGSKLKSIYQPLSPISGEQQRLYDWLGGMLDGEGSCTGRHSVNISQSDANPEVQALISDTLRELGIDFGFWEGDRRPGRPNPNWSTRGHWWMNGGRSLKIKLLAYSRMAKRQRIIDSLWAGADRFTECMGEAKDHIVTDMSVIGDMPVYGLTTTTGNYVAWGFASQNSGQFQQRPSAAAGGQLKREYWNYWNPAGTDVKNEDGTPATVKIKIGNEYIEKKPVALPAAFEQTVQSWDMAFKDADTNDFVVGQAWGRVGANIYLLAREHGHFDFPRTLQAVRKMSATYPCPEKLVEDKANGPAVIATLRNEIPGLIPINPDGGKESRVNAISGYAEAGNIYLPNPNLYPWVKDLIDEWANFPVSVHDDDTDAMTQAARRLFDSAVNTGVPEFRVMPRMNEPETASHVEHDSAMLPSLAAHWRRWIAVAPGMTGAALWICETPSKSLRVYRELSLEGCDAHEAGRRIGEASLSDVRSYLASVHLSAKWNIDVLLEKEAFTPIEPIGSYAELLEQGILSFDPTQGSWDDRQASTSDLRQAKFSAQMAEMEDSAFDRLRDLLRFKPADYEVLSYDRAKAHALAKLDINLYQSYMAAVEGRIPGEYPKIKFSGSCVRTVAALGAVRRDEGTSKIADEFMRALLIGISAPPSVMTQRPNKEIPWNSRNQAKFARRSA